MHLEEPAFTTVRNGDDGLELVWNDFARGMVLQQASPSMTGWQDIPGSSATNRVRVAVDGEAALFRLREL